MIVSPTAVECSNTKAFVFVPNTGFDEIKDEYKISMLKPKKTLLPFKKEELFFFGISPDSLQKLIHNKPLINLKIQSTLPINYLKDKKPSTSKNIDLEYIYNPSISFDGDSASIELKHRIELLNYELRQEQTIRSLYESGRRQIHDSITQLTVSIDKMDLYHREKATETIIKLRSRLSILTAPNDNSEKLLLQLRQLNDKLKNNNVAADIEFYHQKQLILKTKTKNGRCYFQIKKGNYTLVISRCIKDTINYIADRTKDTFVVINTECEM